MKWIPRYPRGCLGCPARPGLLLARTQGMVQEWSRVKSWSSSVHGDLRGDLRWSVRSIRSVLCWHAHIIRIYRTYRAKETCKEQKTILQVDLDAKSRINFSCWLDSNSGLWSILGLAQSTLVGDATERERERVRHHVEDILCQEQHQVQ